MNEEKVERQPGSMLEVMLTMLDGNVNDSWLDEFNMGTGNYSAKEYWLQVDEYRKALYGEAAMSRRVMERAVEEAKAGLVDAIFERPDSRELDAVQYPDPKPGQSQSEYFDEHAEDIWRNLGTADYTKAQHQSYLVTEYTGIKDDWVPPHLRMIKMRHEASQSKDARALDNLFERVKEVRGQNGGDKI